MRVCLGIAVAVLLVGLSGCGGQPAGPQRAQIEPSSGIDAPPPAEKHPPYDSQGRGELTGVLVSVGTKTYRAGSIQHPVPFPVAIVKWDDNGTPRESEFILSYLSDLVVDGRSIIDTPTDDAVDVAPRALRQAGPDRKVKVAYEGSALVPFQPLKRDYPYAIATSLTVMR